MKDNDDDLPTMYIYESNMQGNFEDSSRKRIRIKYDQAKSEMFCWYFLCLTKKQTHVVQLMYLVVSITIYHMCVIF